MAAHNPGLPRFEADQTGRVEEQILAGGVANAGRVTRVGEQVLRPANPHSRSIHRFLAWLRSAGLEGASVPVRIDPDGREGLVFIEGMWRFPRTRRGRKVIPPCRRSQH